MERRLIRAAALSFLLCAFLSIPSLGQEGEWSFILKGNYTTSAEIFPNPTASDPVVRAQFHAVEDFFGFGAEVSYRFPESLIALGVSADHIRASLSRSLQVASRRPVSVEDGYDVIPVEITGYFIIPASGPRFGLFIGGGGGIYFGRRVYSVAGVSAPVVDTRPGLGIHVLAGGSFRFLEHFSVIGEMKFRDLQFESTNQFSASRIEYNGAVINVGDKPFDSRVQTDGVLFQLGVAFHF